MNRERVWSRVRLLAAAAILGVVVWRLGTGPFVHGLRSIDTAALVAAVAITVVTTLCSALRWRVVARGLGVELSRNSAIAAYYRSQFLNSALPGGVLGDVHRAVAHGREVGDVSGGVRAVVWERCTGQALQVVVAVGVLLALPSPLHAAMPYVAGALALSALAVAALVRRAGSGGQAWWSRVGAAVSRDLRAGVLSRRAWPTVVVTSAVVLTGHLAMFLVAARTAGVHAPLRVLVPLALLVLVAAAFPTNVGGWGPREGVAAWAFGAAGLGAGSGVAVATVFGILVVAATLPGAAVLLVDGMRRSKQDDPVGAGAGG